MKLLKKIQNQRSRRSFNPSLDGLEKREVYAVSVVMRGTTLVANITGTDAAQDFELIASASTRKLVYNDGRGWKDVISGGTNVYAGTVTRIEVNGSDMANRIKLRGVNSGAGFNSALENQSSPRVVVNCRGGNDEVDGSSFSDRIDGGAGNDSINAYDGNDQLIAGTGRDTLFGGNGDDYIEAMNPDSNSRFEGGGQNTADRYKGKRPGQFRVYAFENTQYV